MTRTSCPTAGRRVIAESKMKSFEGRAILQVNQQRARSGAKQSLAPRCTNTFFAPTMADSVRGRSVSVVCSKRGVARVAVVEAGVAATGQGCPGRT